MEKLGPVFVKFGQILATRPDILPLLWREELKKLQDSVAAQDFALVEKILNEHLGQPWQEVFQELDPSPMGAASLSQVHKAILSNGRPVVVKVQRFGLEKWIHEDLFLLGQAVRVLEAYYPQLEDFQLKALADEFTQSLLMELDFDREADHLNRFAKAFAGNLEVHIPYVYSELSGPKVLVMEALIGEPLCQVKEKSPVEMDLFMRRLWQTYTEMVLSLGLFHGDLHGGNVFWLQDDRLALVDFGLVGTLSPSTQTTIFDLLMALKRENFEGLAQCYMNLAPYSAKTDVFLFAQELRELLAPRLQGRAQQVNLGQWLLESVAVASSHHLKLPSELILFFRSLVTVEGTLKTYSPDFNFLEQSFNDPMDFLKSPFGSEGMKRSGEDLAQGLREAQGLVSLLPGQLKLILKRWNSPEYSFPVEIQELRALSSSLERASGFLVSGLVISSLIVSGSLMATFLQGSGPLGWPWMSWVAYALAALLSLVTYLKIKA